MKVTVFGGSTCSEAVGKMAEELGKLLAQAGHTVITGGYGGVMSAVSKGAREAGGEAIGVVLKGIGEPNMFVGVPALADNYWDRLGMLMEMGDAYIAFPGNSGTSTELLAALYTQANRMRLLRGSPKKPVILLYSGFDDEARIVSFLYHAAGSDYAFPALLLRTQTPQEAVSYLTPVQ